MGAWGIGPFENDDAADWFYELEKSKGTEVLEATIAEIEGNDDYLEAPECCNALAAAEVVAAYQGKARADLRDDIKSWIAGHPLQIGDGLRDRTLKAVQRLLANSELQELWAEQEEEYAD